MMILEEKDNFFGVWRKLGDLNKLEFYYYKEKN